MKKDIPSESGLEREALPTDTHFAQSWHLTGQWGINVASVWDDWTGAGIRVAVFDDGIENVHPDLDANYDVVHQYNAETGVTQGWPIANADNHGTAVAGIIAAERNGVGVVGVSYGATLVSIYQDYDFEDPDEIVNAYDHARLHADVMNNSWGYTGAYVDSFNGPVFDDDAVALRNAVQLGRGGLGLVVVQSAGNEGDQGDNTNFDDFASNRFTITVAATSEVGLPAWFSSPGSSVLVTAPGEDIWTTDRVGAKGYNPDAGYDGLFGGTSAAAPVVSGVAALMLDANPLLGWRDVQEILAYSARQTADTVTYRFNGAVDWNGGGLHFSDSSGAGLVDAHAAVRLAETWTRQSTSANEQMVSVNADGEAILSDHETIVRTFTFAAPFEVEHIELDLVNVSHTWTGDIEISLTSPSGMAGLWVPMGFGTYSETWTFDSVQFWGENGAGTWTLTVRDNANFDVGQLGTFTLRLYGSAASANDLYVYTDEFNEMFALDADQRGALNDGDGGVDTLNAAALTSGSIVDLAGGTSRIDGHALAIAGGTIENVHGGDAGDRLSGSMAANSLFGGRGDDIVLGDPLGAAGGSDRLEGGAGIDWIDGGGGGDTGTGGAGADVLVGQAGDDVLSGNAGEDGLSGQGGADTLYGGTEGDVLDGGAGDDALHGDEGRDWLNGGAGNDRMWGGDGIDVLLGGEGADVLRGGAGDDMVSGGAGNDVFAFDGLSGHDTVSDFQDGVDLLHFAYDSFTAFQAAGGFIGALAVDGTQIVGVGATQVMVVLAGAGSLTQADLLFGAPP